MLWRKEILARIKPTGLEEHVIRKRIADFINSLSLGDARAILGGSGAKGTWIKDQHDADIFILFPYMQYKEKTAQISDLLEMALRQCKSTYTRVHGSRDYFRISEYGFTYELIPILEIHEASRALNITDISPLHADWVKKNSTKRIRDDIRIAKAFCKAQKLYGAESYIRGFSGYVLEILVIYYGGFERLLKKALLWEEKSVIDVAKLYKKNENVWMIINEAKLSSPLIVIDPVDKTRNAAAALSKEKMAIFRKMAKRFLSKPTAAFFQRNEVALDALKKKKGKNILVWMDVGPTEGKDDVVGAKLMLAFDFIRKELRGFTVAKSDWDWDRSRAVFWFMLKKRALSRTDIRQGPPLELTEHVQKFRKIHPIIFERSGHVWAKIPVATYRLQDVVTLILEKDYVDSKIRNTHVQIIS